MTNSCLKHVQLERSTRHPGRDILQAIGSKSLKNSGGRPSWRSRFENWHHGSEWAHDRKTVQKNLKVQGLCLRKCQHLRGEYCRERIVTMIKWELWENHMMAIKEENFFRKLGEVTNFKCCREMGGKEKRIRQIRKKVIWDPNKEESQWSSDAGGSDYCN